jgi:ribosome hibernation promoting factor
MKIQIQAPWEVNDYTKSVIEEKLHRLDKFSDEIIRADVFLKMGDNIKPNDKIMEVRLHVPGPDIFAEANTDTFEKSVSEVSDKLRVQLLKRKEKRSY